MGLENIIKKLPKMYQDLARTQLKVLVRIAKEESEAWTRLMLVGDYEKAHQGLIKRMSTQEVLDDTKELLKIMRQLNKDAKAEIDMWREFFTRLVLLGLARLEKEISE